MNGRLRAWAWTVGALLLGGPAGCASPSDCPDADGDGFTVCQGDCDDDEPTVRPGAPELCDGLDNDCAGGPEAAEADLDGDGLRLCEGDCDDEDPARTLEDQDGDGLAGCLGDCDDTRPEVFPGATDDWGDGVDGDCDGVDGLDWDGDGYPGNAAPSSDEHDCDDQDPAVHPGDLDGDGISACDGDCDDGDPDAWPGHPWEPAGDDRDQDCDGYDGTRLTDAGPAIAADDGTSDTSDLVTSLGDLDGDGRRELLLGGDWGTASRIWVLSGGSLPETGVATTAGALASVSWTEITAHALAWNLGDVDGDGLEDLLVGDSVYPGDPAIFTGAQLASGGQLDMSEGWRLGPSGDHGVRFAPEGAADFDGDGLDDVVLAGQETGQGVTAVVWIVPGAELAAGDLHLGEAPTSIRWTGVPGWMPESAVILPDLDGDGAAELAVCSPRYGIDLDSPSEVLVFLGSQLREPGVLGPSDAHATVTGGLPWDGLGHSLVVLDDLDGDGLPELAMSAPDWQSPEEVPPGAVHVFGGAALLAGGELTLDSATLRISGPPDVAWVGRSLVAPGDLDGDGLLDLAVGSLIGMDGSVPVFSREWIFLAAELQTAGEVALEEAVVALDDTVSLHGPVGDLDGDGRDDLLHITPFPGAPWDQLPAVAWNRMP